jgi:hypothetical protein
MKTIARRATLIAAATALAVSLLQFPLDRSSNTSQALTGAGSVTELQVTGRAGVPGDASAVVLNLTAVDAGLPGFVTAFPCGSSRPNASNLNYSPGLISANAATVPVGAGGKVCLYTHTAVNLVVDINGWHPANANFRTVAPQRLLDTREPGAPVVPTGLFVETFTGNTGLDRFDFGVYHRDEFLMATTSWQGDHDLACGDPTATSRTIRRNTNEWIYVCRDHVMTSIGDTSGYSTAWFAPKQSFSGATQVWWDVNVTDLGARQWWEVMLVPTSFSAGVAQCPQCAVEDFLSPDPSGLPRYPNGSVVVGNGPFGRDVNVATNGVKRNVAQYQSVCSFDAAGCQSKAIRRTFSITDNRNGTITVNYGGLRTFTVPGSFPAGGFKVILKDHSYTPNKDGRPAGYTWHWDNIIVR